jgi:sigma-54 dependent transcriptional regulator, acetoin dehydrogenase operon transcriptional activator AcoR
LFGGPSGTFLGRTLVPPRNSQIETLGLARHGTIRGVSTVAHDSRLTAIAAARSAVMQGAGQANTAEPWIAQSWQRCLAMGHRPQQRVGFDVVTQAALRRCLEANEPLRAAAAAVLDDLARTIAPTRYFCLLTDAQGIVAAVGGAPDGADRRVAAIARVGVDLSERSVGTTAIGAALGEQRPVWLHRGEHFFEDTAVYSCAGAPIADPDGRCIGMLDITGVLAKERPELRHLAARMARRIETALLLARPHERVFALQWPGATADEDAGLLAVDGEGAIVGTDRTARDMLALPARAPVTLEDVFALPPEQLMGQRSDDPPRVVPLWSGVRLQLRAAQAAPRVQPLRASTAAMIRQAVRSAQGNVAEAARRLGVSRATVYRVLAGQRKPPRG